MDVCCRCGVRNLARKGVPGLAGDLRKPAQLAAAVHCVFAGNARRQPTFPHGIVLPARLMFHGEEEIGANAAVGR